MVHNTIEGIRTICDPSEMNNQFERIVVIDSKSGPSCSDNGCTPHSPSSGQSDFLDDPDFSRSF
jgi:hypothetical protein